MEEIKYYLKFILIILIIIPVLSFTQTNNIARIEQVGQNNFATQTQSGSNLAKILQKNVYTNTAQQEQTGNSNLAAIMQNRTLQNSTAIQEQTGSSNKAKIIQENGMDNYAEQYQSGSNNSGRSEMLYYEGLSHAPVEYGAFLKQTGNSSYALQEQYGNNNYNYILQNGNNQRAVVTQKGNQLNHVLIQERNDAKYKITQTSATPTIIIHQK
jgi:hypothetical protein